MKLSVDFENYWNKKYFPFDYINDSQLILGEIISSFVKYYSDNLPQKEVKKSVETLNKKITKPNFHLDSEEENEVFSKTILDFFKLQNLLPMEKYYYLYLEHGFVPFLDVSKEEDLLGVLNIKDVDKFSNECFNTGFFGIYATQKDIKKYINEFPYEYLDKIVTCYENINNINLLVLSDKPWVYQKYNVLRGMIDHRVFRYDRPTKIIYFSNNTWKHVLYKDINSDDLETSTYEKMGEPNKQRLKTLVDILYEKEDVSKLAINYEPTDIGKELPIIKIDINGKEQEFSVGSTYNLYYKQDGKIVGKIDVINVDEGKGKANIHWIEGYPSLLG